MFLYLCRVCIHDTLETFMFFEIIRYIYFHIHSKEYFLLRSTSKEVRQYIDKTIDFDNRVFFELTMCTRFVTNSVDDGLMWRYAHPKWKAAEYALELQSSDCRPRLSVEYRPGHSRLYAIDRIYRPNSQAGAAHITFQPRIATILLSEVVRNSKNSGRVGCTEFMTLQSTFSKSAQHSIAKSVKISFSLNQITGKITATAVYYSACKLGGKFQSGTISCHKFIGSDVVQLVRMIRNQETVPVDVLAKQFAATSVCWYH
jgi:hypothetical protein